MKKLVAMIALPRLRLGGLVTGLALLLSASAPAATIVGTAKNEVIRGTAKADKLYGKAGNDKLYGLGGNDTLVGGAGNDTLVGGAGSDKLQCGPGHDVVIADAKDSVLADCERSEARCFLRSRSATPPLRKGV